MAAKTKRWLPLLRDYWYLIASAGIGLVTGLIVYVHLAGVSRIAPVLVAAADIPAGSTVDDRMVRIAYLPRQAIHPRAVSTAAGARGRVAHMAILAGEQVLDSKLSGGTSGETALLEDGERAMFIPIAPERAYPASFLRPGGRVDLIFVSDPGLGGSGLARLLLSGVKVLAVHAERQGAFGRDEAIHGVTVAMDVSQAERAAYAVEHGQIHLLGEGAPGDRGAGTGVTWRNLFAATGEMSPTVVPASAADQPAEQEGQTDE